MPAHAARRRPALPALLLTVGAAALGGLALLPATHPRVSATPSTEAAGPVALALQADSERAAVLGRPPVTRTAPTRVAAVRPAARPAAKPLPRPVVRAARSKRAALPLGSGYVCPVQGASFTDTWGDPRPNGRRHQGTDVLAPYGRPVLAVTSGVIKVDYSSSGGISLYLDGSDGDVYFYAHNSRNVASTGEHVAAGEVIAYVGTSGNARGGPAHVHFERHPGGGGAVDSYPFLRRACG